MRPGPIQNANPTIHVTRATNRQDTEDLDDKDLVADEGDDREDVIADEVFDLLRHINDPEHPLTLEQLAVITPRHVSVQGEQINVMFTPTIPHCSMATLIGLCIRVRLLQCLPSRYKVDVSIEKGTHQSEEAVNKQLNDKERVAAALDNSHLLSVVQTCLARTLQ